MAGQKHPGRHSTVSSPALGHASVFVSVLKLGSWLQQRAITDKKDKLWGGSPGPHTLRLLTGLPAFWHPQAPLPGEGQPVLHLTPWHKVSVTSLPLGDVSPDTHRQPSLSPTPMTGMAGGFRQGRQACMGAGAPTWRSLALSDAALLLPCQQVALASCRNSGEAGPVGSAEDNGCLSQAAGGGQRRLCWDGWGAGNLGKEPETRTEGPGAYCGNRLSVSLSFPGLLLALPSVLPLMLIQAYLVLLCFALLCACQMLHFFNKPKARSLPNPRKRLCLAL